MDIADEGIQIPEVVGARFTIDTDEKYVSCQFLSNLGGTSDGDEPKAIGVLHLEYADYLDFAMSFLTTGMKIEEDYKVDLGIRKNLIAAKGVE